MSSARSITSAWQFYADFYRDLSERRGWSNQAAMLEFVERIAPEAIAEEIYPRNSHEVLTLSKLGEDLLAPMVSLRCWGHDARFAVCWCIDSRNKIETETAKHIDDALWQRIVAWLQTHEQTA